MNDCIFCRIATDEIPTRIADRSEHAVAFHDLNPQAPVHVLVIP
ncbi:MAG TPA: HIT domain-containing protein, partial [Gemmatimonadales bacterium]